MNSKTSITVIAFVLMAFGIMTATSIIESQDAFAKFCDPHGCKGTKGYYTEVGHHHCWKGTEDCYTKNES